jgi:GNAT superfamily N-acetyltransferase
MTTITLRSAGPDDRAFIDGLSSRLSGVPRSAWHDLRRLGYIHLRPAKDGVTDEPCGYISLLATTPEAEGTGVARHLIGAAEGWARGHGYRLLSLDVFADNTRAIEFYERRGFRPETFRMVKPL